MADNDAPQEPAYELGTVASLLVGTTALAAALAYYMGWTYEKEYLEEWGIPFSSFSYTPYELIVASTPILIAVVTASIGGVVGYLTGPTLGRAFMGDPQAEAKPLDWLIPYIWGGGTMIILLTLAVSAIVRDDLGGLASVASLIFVLAVIFMRTQRQPGRWLLIAVCVGSVSFLTLYAPRLTAESDARRDMANLDRLPRAEIVLESQPGPALHNGPWRVLRVNDGRVWMVPDIEGETRVTQLDLSDIAAVVYLPEDEDEPRAAATPSPNRSRDRTPGVAETPKR